MPENFDPERYAHRRPPEDGPERYAPPHRRPPETRDEGVKNVVTLLAKQQPETPAESISATEHLDVMIRRIAMDSMTEIGRVIRDLENVSEMLRNEGARVSREVSGYAGLNQAATAAMKVIAESLKQWKERPSQNKEAAN
jgi:hypothetical protein